MVKIEKNKIMTNEVKQKKWLKPQIVTISQKELSQYIQAAARSLGGGCLLHGR